MHAMPATRVTILMVVAVSTVLTLVLPVIVPGCGPANLDVDKAALYTPESLASELAFRFRSLNPDAKASSRKAKSKADKGIAERVARNAKVEKKGSGAKKKQTGPTTIDDVLDDIDHKLDLIKGMYRPEACRKMIDTLSRDSSLTESDKKTLTELVAQLANGR
jgi:hypothetical protein